MTYNTRFAYKNGMNIVGHKFQDRYNFAFLMCFFFLIFECFWPLKSNCFDCFLLFCNHDNCSKTKNYLGLSDYSLIKNYHKREIITLTKI